MARSTDFLPVWLLSFLVVGCGNQTTLLAISQQRFVLDRQPEAVATSKAREPVTRAAAPPVVGQPQTPVAVPSSQAPMAPAGGGSGGGGDSAGPAAPAAPSLQADTAATVTLPDGRTLLLPPGDAITIPAGTTGLVSVTVPGRVAETVQADGQPLVVHPRQVDLPTNPSAVAHLSGHVTPAAANIAVAFVTPGHHDGVNTQTDASGAYALDVPADAPVSGLVVARNGQGFPALAVGRATLDPAAATTADLALEQPGNPIAPTVSALRLLGANDGPSALPAPPQGLAYQGASLQVWEGQGTNAWALDLVDAAGVAVPAYGLAGFTQVATLRAANADNTQGSLVMGPVAGGAVALKKLLTPPDLAAQARPAAGGQLAWSPVAGATLYIARVHAAYQVDPPLWEGATTGTSLPLPATLPGLAGDLRVTVDAWDAPDVSLYSVASADGVRRLRLPVGDRGPTGRHSWAVRYYR